MNRHARRQHAKTAIPAADMAAARHEQGLALRQAGREAEAAAAFRAATQARPDAPLPWKDLGLSLAITGDLAGAEAALTRAVALAPGFGEAQRHLAALRRQAANIPALQAALATPNLPAPERVELLFALARQQEAQGAYDPAFAAAREANGIVRAALAAAGRGFDRARLHRDIGRIAAAFPAGGFGAGADPTEAPVFIVGMPRAGSSLVEQIAASHSKVFGAGEQDGIGRIAAQLGWSPNPRWTPQALKEAARAYLAPIARQARGAARIIDKMPDNIFQLGLIAHLFPKARVIFCVRDKRDVAISCFFQHFAAPLGFDTDLADCAFRMAELERLVAHWRAALPLRQMTLSYEALLQNPEAESRRLIEFLGLEWEAACLDFHQTKREVRTASWSQVRQPLYQSSSGRWRHYATHLPPELAAG